METLMIMTIVVFFLMLLTLVAVPYFMGVAAEINYYKMEIRRSTNDKARNYWKRKLRRFILKQIPIVNLFIKR